jgi:hypothetical protein
MARLTEMVFGGQKGNVEFYESHKYSTWALATGATAFQPFNNIEAANLRNYDKGQNIFKQNQGRILALRVSFHGPAYVNPTLQTGATFVTLTATQDYNAFMAQARLSILQDSQLVHEDLLSSYLPYAPWIYQAPDAGTPTAATRPLTFFDPNDGNGNNYKASKWGVVFRPPLVVGAGRSVDFQVTTPPGYSLPSTLNGFYVRFELVTEELPQSSISQVRPA